MNGKKHIMIFHDRRILAQIPLDELVKIVSEKSTSVLRKVTLDCLSTFSAANDEDGFDEFTEQLAESSRRFELAHVQFDDAYVILGSLRLLKADVKFSHIENVISALDATDEIAERLTDITSSSNMLELCDFFDTAVDICENFSNLVIKLIIRMAYKKAESLCDKVTDSESISVYELSMSIVELVEQYMGKWFSSNLPILDCQMSLSALRYADFSLFSEQFNYDQMTDFLAPSFNAFTVLLWCSEIFTELNMFPYFEVVLKGSRSNYHISEFLKTFREKSQADADENSQANTGNMNNGGID